MHGEKSLSCVTGSAWQKKVTHDARVANDIGRGLPHVGNKTHSKEFAFVVRPEKTHVKELAFVVQPTKNARQTRHLCRVPRVKRTTKNDPFAVRLCKTHGKGTI
jgi:hypothetical protein